MIVPDRRMSWFRLLFEYRGSTLPRIRGRLASVFLVACAVTAVSELMGGMASDLTTIPFTLISLALGVFLGFRNNTSYDRFWEGRRLWGQLVNESRSFARMTLSLVSAHATSASRASEADARAVQQAMIYRVIAFVHSLRMHLRNDLGDTSELAPFLTADELGVLPVQRNVPLFVLRSLSKLVASARHEGILRHRDVHLLEEKLSAMTDVQGGCERIRATPIPWSYTVLIHSIVAVYCFALPFGLISTTGLMTPVVVGLIAYAFLGLDAVGDEIEEPFGTDCNDLPLSALSRTIEVNLRQLLEEEDLPPLLVPDELGQLS